MGLKVKGKIGIIEKLKAIANEQPTLTPTTIMSAYSLKTKIRIHLS